MTTISSGTERKTHERMVIVEAMRGGSLKPHERALAALFLVAIAILVGAAWHYAHG